MKKIIKTLTFVLLIVFAVAFVFGCGGSKDDTNTGKGIGKNDDNAIVIGVSLPQLDADGFSANLIGIKEEAAKYNAAVIPFDAANEVDKQIKQIEDFITQGVDAIIFIPIDASAMVAGVEKANSANIPIIAMDRATQGGNLSGLVESDNVAHGRAAADLMLEAAKAQGKTAKDLKVLELLGAQASSSGIERHEGFTNRAKELGITIVSALPTEYQADKAYAATLDAFQANPDINAITMASDVAMYSGVESALKQLNKLYPVGQDGHIIITGIDGGPQGIAAIKAGYIDGIAGQSLLEIGTKSVDIAMKTINGENVEERIIRIEPQLIKKDNADSVELWAVKIANK